ncbi:eukaryotic translation initiation factor 5-like [Biomphalaria glabrata]|uniref:Eukaryotic translation initiation factor 5 n=1 Tax=Biomphalaria glabrata TaxID=6526 RepID=A0A9W2ZVX5_BIOGL|nr:eukaryotic translation initiation factor 5-like [Biomphalaria glabrata]XP_055879054.1 eukaryotic translation initiation factor 5-like [Biomphalaria glabrata]
MSFNIDRSNTDPFYRYKMPRLIAKVEGKGNGIKTVIVNMTEVAKALSRPPTYPTKFFGCELGAQTQFDTKNDRYIVNGSHTDEKLQTLLDGFIKKFVLCPGCSNPETNLVVQVKRGTILQRCIACGYNGSVDMRHKLTTFILKNPPDQDPNAAATPVKGKKGKKERGSKKDEEDGASPDATPSTAQEQIAAIRESGKSMNLPPTKQKGDDDDEDWGDDFTEEAIKQRMEELSDAAKGLAFTDDLEKSAEERLNIIYEKIKIKKDEDELTKQTTIKEIFSEAERLEVKDKVPLVLVELLLTDKVLTQLQKFKGLFLKFCIQDQKAQKALLGGLEILITREYPDLLPKTSHILKVLYDFDILEESVIVEWGKKPSKKYVSKEESTQILKEAQVFVKWLEEAEEESDEEYENGEEEDEVNFSHTERVGEVKVELAKSTVPVVNGGKKPVIEEDDDEDDIDIDDI